MPDIDDAMTPVDSKIDAAQILTGLARLLRSDQHPVPPANKYSHQVQVECRRVQSPGHRHAPQGRIVTGGITPTPVPPTSQWTWGPTRSMSSGYQGTCSVGPMNFVVIAAQDYRGAWLLNCSVALADITLAKITLELVELRCTPEGVLREVAERGVLTQ